MSQTEIARELQVSEASHEDVVINAVMFDNNGMVITKWGSSSSCDGQCDSPIDITVYSKGVYAVDPSKTNIVYQQLGADYADRIIAL